jgi:uncharacterized membrane protein
MLSSLTGMSAYVYVALGIGGLVILGAIAFVVWFNARRNFEHGAEAQKATAANARAEMSEAEVDLMRRQGGIMSRDESREDTAKSLDEGSF